jgi:hypothetical protein
MRDHIDGLEYLRSGTELAARGFHTHLNGYQYRALIDFRALTDEDGLWRRLADHLAGRGAPDLVLAKRRLVVGAELARLRSWMDPIMLAWLEVPLSQPAPSAGEEESSEPHKSDPPVTLPRELMRRAEALRDLADLEIPPGLGSRTRSDLEKMIESLPGSRIPQAVYLQAVLTRIPGPWNPEASLGDNEAGLEPGDLSLVLEDLGALVREWTGHDYAGDHTALLAEILARAGNHITDLGRGKAKWFIHFCEDPRVRRFLGFNEHEGTAWLNREALDSLLTAMVICGLTGPEPVPPASLLDGRALIASAAARAGFAVEKMLYLLADK